MKWILLLLSDVSPVGRGISELGIHYGPGCHVYFSQNGNEIILLLCDGVKRMKTKETVYDYDSAAVLDSQEAIAIFMADALETRDAVYIAKALGVVTRAQCIAEIAQETGLFRE